MPQGGHGTGILGQFLPKSCRLKVGRPLFALTDLNESQIFKFYHWRVFRILIFVVALVAVDCCTAMADVQVEGGGASFPNPIYQQWAKDFGRDHPQVRIDYVAKGSGAGIGGLIDKTFDFAGSDAPMSEEELAKARRAGGEVVQFPSIIGAVVLAYNLPDLRGELKLSGPMVADIYLGRITQWNDPAIKALNPRLVLPDTPISAVHRSEGSGTNFVFTSYLCTQSDDFETQVYFGKTVRWPAGQAAQGNPGVTQVVQETQGAIGYIELNYAIDNHIPFALMQNQGDEFVKASPASASAAGEAAVADMDQYKTLAVRLWTRAGKDVYPISCFSYLICYKDLGYLKDKSRAQVIVDFFWYATHDGQKKAEDLAYAPLSEGVRQRVQRALDAITFNGQPLHPNP
jgi:phosphate transport system substrate-binding protein